MAFNHKNNLIRSKLLIQLLIVFNIMVNVDAMYEDMMYKNCEMNKNCLGVKTSATYKSSEEEANECIKVGNESLNQKCDYILQYRCDNLKNLIIIKLYALKRGKENGYVAAALSTDRKMGNDIVMACVWNKNNISSLLSYNVGRNNVVLKDNTRFRGTVMEKSDIDVYCELTLSYIGLKLYDDEDFEYDTVRNILIAGAASDVRKSTKFLKYECGHIKGELWYHDARISTKSIVWHSSENTNEAQEASYHPERLHACYMICSWITWVPIGSFISRFYKETWAQSHYLSKRIFFVLHTACMFMTLGMAGTGYILLLYDRQHIIPPPGSISNVHGTVGMTALALLVFECCINWCRPTVIKVKKVISIVHCVLGHIIYFLGIINIMFTPHWTYNVAPLSIQLQVVGWLLFHILMYVLMTVYFEWTDRHLDIGGSRALCQYPMPIVTDQEAPRPTFRKLMLLLFTFGSITMAGGMMYTIQANPPYVHV